MHGEFHEQRGLVGYSPWGHKGLLSCIWLYWIYTQLQSGHPLPKLGLRCIIWTSLYKAGGLVCKSCPTLATPWTIAHQAPVSIGFSRQEYWSGLPFPSPGDLSDTGIKPRSPALQADSLLTELWRKPSIRLSSVQFSHSVVSDSLRPHESKHARPPCPSPTPRVHSNSCPLSQWCHPAISSSVVPFSSCPQSLPASESFPMSQLFTSGSQSTGVSALASVLPKNTQDWFPSGLDLLAVQGTLKSLLLG